MRENISAGYSSGRVEAVPQFSSICTGRLAFFGSSRSIVRSGRFVFDLTKLRPTVAVIGVILLDEHFGPGLAAGILLVTLGLWVMARAKEEEIRGDGN